MGNIQIIQGIECYEKDGTVYLRLETVARGLGFTKTEIKDGKEYSSIRWARVDEYLKDLGFSTASGRNYERPDFIPENVFYRLAMKAKNSVAETFQAKVADEIIPAIRKTGTYSAKTLTAAELILCQAQQLVEQEKRVMLLESHAKEQDARLDELEAKPHYINNKRRRTHTHLGYEHDENGTRNITSEEWKLIRQVRKKWYNYQQRQGVV